jgi:hypothetical protein
MQEKFKFSYTIKPIILLTQTGKVVLTRQETAITSYKNQVKEMVKIIYCWAHEPEEAFIQGDVSGLIFQTVALLNGNAPDN